jgi:CIC family chloride channel protein
LTLGSGNAGGDLAPTLFLGATIGSLIGRAGNELVPDIVVNPGAFALVGMASMFAGAARAPITAIILVLEMSNDYRLIVPLMLGVVVSTVLSDLMQTDSIYTLKLSLRGIRLQRGQDVDLLQSVSVEDVMDLDYETINPDMPLIDLMVRLNQSHHHGFPMIDEHNHLVGIVTLTDVERAQAEQIPFDTTVRTFGTTRNLQTVYPDDPMYLALRRMTVYDIGRLPVVAPGTSDHYIGMIRREGILRAYDIGLTRKSFELHRDERFRLRNIQDAAFLEINVGPDAPMIGKPLADFPYSNDCLLLSIRRHGDTIIAHGDTTIEANDLIVAYADNKHHQSVLEQFGALPPEPEPRHSRLRI